MAERFSIQTTTATQKGYAADTGVTLFLDYDGTLHESMHIYAAAFRRACDYLAARGLCAPREYTDAEICKWLGYPPADMWHNFMPQLTEAQWRPASELIGVYMIEEIRTGGARLFPHAEEILAELKASGYTLVFLSNCRRAYLDASRTAFQLDRFFAGFHCIEDYPSCSSKADMYAAVKNQYPGKHIIIGDRFHDMEVARIHNIPAIGCGYGYGTQEELNAASLVAKDISELPHLVKVLSAEEA